MSATAAAFCAVTRNDGCSRGGAVDEQPHRLELRQRGRRVTVACIGQRQRGHRVGRLAGDVAAARGWSPGSCRCGPACSKRLRELRARVDQVLAVVEDEQQLPVRDVA